MSGLDEVIRAFSPKERKLLRIALLLMEEEAEKDQTMPAAVVKRLCHASYERVCKAAERRDNESCK